MSAVFIYALCVCMYVCVCLFVCMYVCRYVHVRGGIDWNSLVVELFHTLVKVSIVDRTPNQKI